MTRIYIFCEGHTEELFVQNLLAPHFTKRSIQLIPILIGGRAGGVNTYGTIKRQLGRKCKEDPGAYVTTLFDYYAFPTDSGTLKPARQEHDPIERGKALTEALQKDIGHKNFIANLVLHEYEGLLFSRPEAFAAFFDAAVVKAIKTIRGKVLTPEHINGGRETAPSKRLKALCKAYDKTRHGPRLAQEMRLEVIRHECPVFNAWLIHLESLSADNSHENS